MRYKVPSGLFVDVRPFRYRDFDYVANIELKSYDLIWPAQTWDHWLLSNCQVAVVRGRVVGFCIAKDYGTILRINRLAVTPSFRRMRIGSCLLHDAIESYPATERLFTAVGESWTPAIHFLKSQGLRAVKTFGDFPIDVAYTEMGILFEAKINNV